VIDWRAGGAQTDEATVQMSRRQWCLQHENLLAGDTGVPAGSDQPTTSLRRCDACPGRSRLQSTRRSESSSQEANTIRSDILGAVAGLLRL